MIDLIKKFKKWCRAERYARAEKGTSQDMCPTNGDALFMTILFSVAPVIIIILILTKGI